MISIFFTFFARISAITLLIGLLVDEFTNSPRETKIITHSDEETRALAKRVFQEHVIFAKKKPVVFLLFGPLGAGKTVFVKGIGEALGVNTISSPTFVLIHEYT